MPVGQPTICALPGELHLHSVHGFIVLVDAELFLQYNHVVGNHSPKADKFHTTLYLPA